MNYQVKIVMAGINIVCLLITLVYPNPATPFSLLPVIVTATSWVFLTKNGVSGTERRRTTQSFLVTATFVAALCILFGTTSRILPTESGDRVIYTIDVIKEVAFLGGVSFNYHFFAIPIGLSIIILIIKEVAGSRLLSQAVPLIKDEDKPLDDIVRAHVKQINN